MARSSYKNKKIKLIIDTKYKLYIKSSNQDIYQMMAYGIAGKCSEIVLLYPKTENFTEPNENPITISLHSDECQTKCELPRELNIYIKTVDLMKESLKDSKDEIINELKPFIPYHSKFLL
ncbi:McrBC 5-methylcytosine restriction system component [archaeon BMS3Bbin15]|nr:McrBC 5-methylcytosine restriction system component [archaeon BMS3Bbin15]